MFGHCYGAALSFTDTERQKNVNESLKANKVHIHISSYMAIFKESSENY
jgi:hypothetical protein